MDLKCVLFAVILGICHADKDDKKWVWNENNRNTNARSYSNGVALQTPDRRYNVFEETDDYLPAGSSSPYYPNNQLLSLNQRPPVYEPRPPVSGAGFLPEQRPGGIYGANGFQSVASYGQQRPYRPEETQGVLSGPAPSWLKEGPIKNFDKCKCAEKFNCNSPGISYGHCDVGKQYCCYSTKKDFGGPLPAKPVHSIENGILVGPGGPVDPIPGANNYPRPPKQGAGFYRPGGFQGGQSNNFYGENQGGYREPNEYSPANGVLVGPRGPYDNSYGLGRSATANERTAKAK